jgi:signal transduction histidine kinase/ActR/RegA family two-component response regulator
MLPNKKIPGKPEPRTQITNLTLDRESINFFLPLFLAFGFVYFLLAYNLLANRAQIIEVMAVRDAKSYSSALTEFRTLYTSEVVENVRHNGIIVSHNYQELPSAIPLPATLSMLLGKKLNDESGGQVRLYSAYPFPWRADDGGPQDAFEAEALEVLRAAPNEPFYRFETTGDVQVLRYASADLMRESCVDCHNSLPSSPKKDWKVGDVRGVLSVTKPLAESVTHARQNQEVTLGLMIGLGLWGMGLLALLGTRHRRDARQADQQALKTARANEQLELQIVETAAAEAERRKMEAQVQHAQKLDSIGILAGGLAHDFNNLLQTLLGNTELALLRMQSDQNEKAKANLQKVIEVSDQASKLTQQLLVYAGKATVLKQTIDLSQMVSELSPLLKTLRSDTVNIRYELEQPVPLIYGDRTQLQQVVLNLTANAKQALDGPDQTIVIRCLSLPREDTKEKDFVLLPKHLSSTETFTVLEIQDNGIGIAPGVQNRIFDPFFSTKLPHKGRGLGLAVTHGIVSAHFGGIHVKSELGIGTSIRVYFPVTNNPSSKPQPQTEQKEITENTPANILVVDDDPNVGHAVSELIKLRGYQATHAHDGKSALQYFEQDPDSISLVLLDLQMPEMNGFATFSSLRKISSTIPIILTSGNAPDERVQSLLDSNHATFLQKPHTNDDLVALIEDTLRRT